jgi:hypothetical protein
MAVLMVIGARAWPTNIQFSLGNQNMKRTLIETS